MAYPCSIYNGLALVEAATGALFSMCASLALPCACWVAIYRDEIPASKAAAAATLAVVAVVVGATFTTMDVIHYFSTPGASDP